MNHPFAKTLFLSFAALCTASMAAAQTVSFDKPPSEPSLNVQLDRFTGTGPGHPPPPPPTPQPGHGGNNGHGGNSGHNDQHNQPGHGGNNGNYNGGNSGHNDQHNQPGHGGGNGNYNGGNSGHNDNHGQPGHNNGHSGPWTPTPYNGGGHHQNSDPWNTPYPYPHQWEFRTYQYQSGVFTFSSDAREALNAAVASVSRSGYRVLESRLFGNAYALTVQMPARAEITRYESGRFSFSSDARLGLQNTVQALAARGKAVLEARVEDNRYILSYVDENGAAWQPQLTFTSGNFSFSSDAQESLRQAVDALKASGFLVLESRQDSTAYTITVKSFVNARIAAYDSGTYSFQSDARASMDYTLASMRRSGVIVLEARLGWNDYTISYLERIY